MEYRAAHHSSATGEPRSRVALLGTLGPLHAEARRYDLTRLRKLVEAVEPDLLGIEADATAWERGESVVWPVEVSQALVPAAGRTDTVIVPLGAPAIDELAPPHDGSLVALRAGLVRAADRMLLALQRAADDPATVSGEPFGHLCGLLCSLKAAAAGEAGRRAWERTNEGVLERLLWAVRRDPGRLVLAAVRCHRIHWLRSRLAGVADEIELVTPSDLIALAGWELAGFT